MHAYFFSPISCKGVGFIARGRGIRRLIEGVVGLPPTEDSQTSCGFGSISMGPVLLLQESRIAVAACNAMEKRFAIWARLTHATL